MTPQRLDALSRIELTGLLERGSPIDPSALDDTEYIGTSLGLPKWVDRLTWKTFKKVFYRDRVTGDLRGWNVRLRQDGSGEPLMRGGKPRAFGHFRVIPRERGLPYGLPPCLLLDYGQGGNEHFDPIGLLRDPLVALEPGNPNRLLGWSYLEVGPIHVRTPSFFCLERGGPLTEFVDPP